jgi:hypothetical protein
MTGCRTFLPFPGFPSQAVRGSSSRASSKRQLRMCPQLFKCQLIHYRLSFCSRAIRGLTSNLSCRRFIFRTIEQVVCELNLVRFIGCHFLYETAKRFIEFLALYNFFALYWNSVNLQKREIFGDAVESLHVSSTKSSVYSLYQYQGHRYIYQ